NPAALEEVGAAEFISAAWRIAMKRILSISIAVVSLSLTFGQNRPESRLVELKNVGAVAVGQGGRIFVAIWGEKTGDGQIRVIENGHTTPFASGLEKPLSVAPFQKWLFVSDQKRILRLDTNGKMEVFVTAESFPDKFDHFNEITVDPESG